jgi:hypothetical protein
MAFCRLKMEPSMQTSQPALSVYDEYPYFGRHAGDHAHAPFVIVRCLIRLGLADWSATLLDWLARYDGLEQHLGNDFRYETRFDPFIAVRDVLLQHVTGWPESDSVWRLTPVRRRQRIEAIIDDLLELQFVGANAFWGGKQRSVWDPFTQDWLQFIELGPDLAELRHMGENQDHNGEGLLDAWSSPETARRSRPAIRRMLLAGCMEQG